MGKGKRILFRYNSGPQNLNSKKVILYYHDNHFDVVKNPGLFLYGRKVSFCRKCTRKVNDGNNRVL